MIRVRVQRPVEAGEAVTLSDEQRHHVIVVLRARVGDAVELIDGASARWSALIQSVSPLSVEVTARAERPSSDPAGRLEMWVPLLKGGKTDDLVRQLTELGVAAVTCYVSSRSVARLDPGKVERARSWKVGKGRSWEVVRSGSGEGAKLET